MTLLQLGLGLLVMIIGAELLVRGASRLAIALGLSPLVVGLTVVAYGTSAPELAVSVQASWSGQAVLSIGNIVGSNTFNVLLILGLAALITPLVVSHQLVRLDVPLMIGVSFLLYVFALDGQIARWEGAILVVGALSYTIFLVVQGRKESRLIREKSPEDEVTSEYKSEWLVQVILMIGGLVLLVLGARWMVAAAVVLATALGLSELIIGLTIVAAGTSLPEVATSIVASLRGERDIAVGNVVGSNIFNILLVLGLASLVAPEAIPVPAAARHFDIPVLVAVAVACLPIFFTDHMIARWEGGLFVGYYVAYLLYVILAAAQHRALPVFSHVMLLFVLPLTALTLLVLSMRAFRVR